jgi:flagellar hook-basal body complex protein FliE
MSIDPIRVAQAVGNAAGTERSASATDPASSFQNFLLKSLSDITEAEGTVQNDVISLATGASDGLHNISINAAKADLAIQMVVSVRNKALEAYNEIMRITL